MRSASAWPSRRLWATRRKDLVNAIRTALGRIDILAIMGGLGPTEDDLTREAVADALSLALHRDETQIAALHARAATWHISMPKTISSRPT